MRFWATGGSCGAAPVSPFNFDPAKYAVNFDAVCGYTTQQILTELLPAVLAAKPGCVPVIAGTNDIRLGIDPSVTRANLTKIEQSVISAGACLYLGTIPPWGRASDSWTTGVQQQQVLDTECLDTGAESTGGARD